MAKSTEEEVNDLKERLENAKRKLRVERAEEARKKKEEQDRILAEETATFQETYASEIIGEPKHWYNVYQDYGGGIEITEHNWKSAQYTFFFDKNQTKKLRDILNAMSLD